MRRLPVVGTLPVADLNLALPSWSSVEAGPSTLALWAPPTGRPLTLEFARLLADAFRSEGRAPWIAACEFDAMPAIEPPWLARLREVAVDIVIAPVRTRDDLVGLVAQARRDAPRAPAIFVGAPALFGLRGVIKLAWLEEGQPPIAPAERALARHATAVLTSARVGVAQALARGLLGFTR